LLKKELGDFDLTFFRISGLTPCFCPFQVLGCHGPLANRAPGRAFLPATA